MNNYSSLIQATHNKEKSEGLTHNYYNYPAKFSPIFAREVINYFTSPGDTVLDPFVGGGTSILEAMALGRRGIGIDISTLAIFICKVKTNILNKSEINTINNWKKCIYTIKSIKILKGESVWDIKEYTRNLNAKDTWRLKNYIENLLLETEYLSNCKVKNFIRCSILKTGQWALDGKQTVPKLANFRDKLFSNIDEMVNDNILLADELYKTNNTPIKPILINRNAYGMENEKIFSTNQPKLVIMSPPYPGVHVIYHRWQVKGRKETPAPFWIADQLDGFGESYYTLGNRITHHKEKYFIEMKNIFDSLKKISSPETKVVQLIAFSNPKIHLPRYLELMMKSGFEEINILDGGSEKRVWRKVPNRKWYAGINGYNPSSQEVLLVHKAI